MDQIIDTPAAPVSTTRLPVLPTINCRSCGKTVVAVAGVELCRRCERRQQQAKAKAKRDASKAKQAKEKVRKAETPQERATRSPLDFTVAIRLLSEFGEKRLQEEERKLTRPPRRRGRRR